MKLSSRSDYAAKAMLELSLTPDRPINLAYLAQVENISISYLEQIFALLRKDGLVKSVRGPGGGYILGRPLNEITIGDIVKSIDMSRPSKKAAQSEALANSGETYLPASRKMWEQLSHFVYDYLNNITLADMHDAQKDNQEQKNERTHQAA
ncbi:MAG: Rrf2 family transcriptional regulator [Gammaproteobacteria bacterium]|nr:Rrf2 family transcriptional regulator [Gammaproteobacteria bacterium]